MTGELITAKTIFKNEDGHLFRHLRYTYTYDNENRVTSKEASQMGQLTRGLDSLFQDGCFLYQ